MLSNPQYASGIIRPAAASDMPALARLCADHATFERADPVPDDLATRLTRAMFSPSPRVRCLLAEHHDRPIGYATYTLEFSTWQGCEYVHLDCLFVAVPHRGAGWGQRLFDAVTDTAADLGATQMQWQTPDWNADAIAFYNRIGAPHSRKVRYVQSVGASAGRAALTRHLPFQTARDIFG